MMDNEGSRAIKKVHFRDSSSQVPLITYKRRRRQEPQLTQQSAPEPEPEPKPEHNPGDVPVQQSKDTFSKSRDMGWKYGIMIDENRQHWKCMYCGLIRYGGGVSRLKRHLAGDLDVKMCPKVPADVVEEIREHLRKKRERRRKCTAQNGGNNVNTKSSSDDTNVEKDLQPTDSVLLAGTGTNVLEEATNQTSHQDPAYPREPILRARDIGWEHAVDLDGNKRRWQCKFCSLCRSGGVTTLKAHLIDDSCPNVPKEISKKVSNFIEEKRATRLLLNNYTFSVDEDEIFNTQVQGDRTVEYENDQTPSRNATHVQKLDECVNEMVPGSSQCGEEISGQPVEDCDQPKEQWTLDHRRMDPVINKKSKILDTNTDNSQKTKMEAGSSQYGEGSSGQPVEHGDQLEEQLAVNHGRMDQVVSNKNNILDKSTDNSHKTKILKPCRKSVFNTKKHIIILDEIASHWRCRYCGMDGYGKKFHLYYHLAGAFRHPKCPNVPREVFAKARHHVLTKRRPKMNKAEQQIPSKQFGEEQQINQINGPLCGNQSQLSVKNESNEVHNHSARLQGSAWEHSLIYGKEKGHWKCKWCGVEGYHGVTRLKWHLVGWQNLPQCTDVPKDVAKKIRDRMLSKEQKKARVSGLFVSNGSCDVLCSSKSSELDEEHLTVTMHDGCSSPAFDQANSESKALPNTILLSQESADPQECHEQQRKQVATPKEPGRGQVMEEQPHRNGICGDTNNSNEQRSGCSASECWRYVLDGLMDLHLPDAQGDAGIATCIRDALLYGCKEFGTVAGKGEMDSEKTVIANTAKCQNVLMNLLRSENFALLCSVLCRTVHQDEERTRYFDFGLIDSRMKNGNYGHEPQLFMQDLKLLWEDLKMAGQDIIHLANNLSSLTEESYKKLVGRDRESSDGEPNGAVMTSSEPQNLVQSDGLVPSASQAFNHLAQPGPSGLSDVRNTCNQCCKEARDGSILKCSRCMLSWHISCIEPPDPSISTESWCCKSCSTTCIEPVEDCLHGDCVICDRLEVCRSPECEDAPHDNSRAMVISSVNSVEDPELAEIDTGGSCKICGDPEEDDKRFLICGHSHCLYKYYHIRCLKSKQIAGDVQQGKPCWYCPSCLCRVCLSDKDDHLTILCDSCDEAYHLYCITPRRTSIPKGRWYCSSCRAEKAKEGMKKYRRILKLHQKDNAGQQSTSHEGLDLLLSAMEQLSADEQLVICTN
ncbi:hypothetical protein HU200_050335 [Digitaria exilis]|uniref:Uncharacterized protein n=1 Tax=Digitaria exilis TaxID=1010633 RepID=A0A835ANR2_9POAL|nr:hypothetical protein HU200_050335 [Digitaria exilis]